jgi:hypothetical protein
MPDSRRALTTDAVTPPPAPTSSEDTSLVQSKDREHTQPVEEIQGLFGSCLRPPRQSRACQNIGDQFGCPDFAHTWAWNLNWKPKIWRGCEEMDPIQMLPYTASQLQNFGMVTVGRNPNRPYQTRGSAIGRPYAPEHLG